MRVKFLQNKSTFKYKHYVASIEKELYNLAYTLNKVYSSASVQLINKCVL